MTSFRAYFRCLPWSPLAWVVALSGGLLWAYWPTLATLARRWGADPQYSHGYLVPVFAGVVLVLRRRLLAGATLRPAVWGLPLLFGGTVLRLGGTFFYYDWFDAVSLLPCVAGLGLLLGGWPVLRWSWPAVAFLFFMIPLPYQAELALSHPLQRVATVVSTYSLQTFGFPALAEGNVITLGSNHIGVAEACSGLSMLFVFLALALALCLVLDRPLWQKAVLVASAVPIAVAANVLRITATGVLYQTAGRGVADAVYHDLAGWLMMPVALALLGLELAFLKRLFVPGFNPVPAGPVRVSFPKPELQPVLPLPLAVPEPAARTRERACVWHPLPGGSFD
jgi:exosortase